MIFKLLSKNDVINLRPLPTDVSPSKTISYIPSADETIRADINDIEWLARWYDGRLYRVRSEFIWETKH